MWSYLPVAMLAGEALPVAVARGDRVVRLGTVSFVRAGFARVMWDDGTQTDEWAAQLIVG